ncbi:hypothetical protein AMECASPLE_019781 [Ameca splendens]|uniref:Uncharacterized protein n=1 Tax=Ameca splendens TaxID=208324 RepID=A0ABV0ZNZ6_9TELE
MYYIHPRCLSILTLPVWAVLCQWLTVLLCDGPTSDTSGPHEKSAPSFNRYRQELSLSVSLFSLITASQHTSPFVSLSNSLLSPLPIRLFILPLAWIFCLALFLVLFSVL